MPKSLLRTNKDAEKLEEIYTRRVDMVYRICFTYMKNPADTEDAVQTVFLKLLSKRVVFKSLEHEKAWLIVAAGNQCKDVLKSGWSKRLPLEEGENSSTGHLEVDETIKAIMDLPAKYKLPIYLYYYEGYQSPEIAEIMGKTASAVRNLLSEGRKRLKSVLQDDEGNF